MKDIITGGVYAVNLHGTESYEFMGVHPALIVRMMKEDKMYYVVPLTTYTKERWEKCKRKGFGIRVLSSNSIARVDKLNIVTEKQVQGRYYSKGHVIIPTEKEVEDVLNRVEEYVLLSNGKTRKEYKKFISQRRDFEKDIDLLLTEKKFEEFMYPLMLDNDLSFEYPSNKLSYIGSADIKDIIEKKINCSAVRICRKDSNRKITIEIDNQNLLTFSRQYDKFKSQKGSSNM